MRSSVKQLHPFLASLGQLKAKLKARSAREPIYSKYEGELATMVNGLGAFLDTVTNTVAEAEYTKADEADDQIYVKLTERMDALKAAIDHHLSGAKGAKTRFSAMVQL